MSRRCFATPNIVWLHRLRRVHRGVGKPKKHMQVVRTREIFTTVPATCIFVSTPLNTITGSSLVVQIYVLVMTPSLEVSDDVCELGGRVSALRSPLSSRAVLDKGRNPKRARMPPYPGLLLLSRHVGDTIVKGPLLSTSIKVLLPI